jgi:mycoredoxin
MTDNNEKIKIYATSWCGGSRRARNIFIDNHIDYEWIDIDENVEGGKFVESVNGGYRSVPTIVFPDGTILTEPSTADLMKKLGLRLPY